MSTATPMLLHAKTLTLHWHDDNLPVYTIDFQPNRLGLKSSRLATGGGDNNVRIWQIEYNDEGTEIVGVEYLSTLTKHTQAVNCVRFDPTGELLATASDDGTIIVWALSQKIIKEFGSVDDDIKESWYAKTSCRSSTSSEIYDISWSPDSKYICCGSMDNITRIYNASNGLIIKQISEHNHYVQGVSWDPRNEYVCSQSADRSVHIYKILGEKGNELQLSPTTFYKIQRAELPTTKLPQSPSLNHTILHKPSNSLTSENLEVKNKSELSASPSMAMSSSQNNVTMTTSNSINTPIIGTAPSGSSMSTTMDPPLQTPRHKRTYSNSSTSSNHSLAVTITRCSSPAQQAPLPAVMPPSSNIVYKNFQLYHNETLPSFFRRLSFSPDGLFLFTSSGIYKSQGGENSSANDELINTVYVHTRFGLNKPPVAHLPGFKKPAIAIRFNPIIYKLVPNEVCAFKLSYRMVFAVATQDSVLIFDTQRLKALGIVTNVHYAVITDICWSSDGKVLMVSSADGFVSNVIVDEKILAEVETTDLDKFLKDHPITKPSTKRADSTRAEATSATTAPILSSPLLSSLSSPSLAATKITNPAVPVAIPKKRSNAPSILDMLSTGTNTTVVVPQPIKDQPTSSLVSSKSITPTASTITRTPTPSAPSMISKLTETNEIEVIDITDVEDNREDGIVSAGLAELKDISGPLELELTPPPSIVTSSGGEDAAVKEKKLQQKKKRRVAPTLVTADLSRSGQDGGSS